MTADALTAPAPPGPPADGDVQLTIHAVGRRLVVRVAGEIDMATVPVLADAIDAAIGSGALELWIDLTPTTFMDSSGMNALLTAQVRLHALNRRLAVICPGGPVRRVFELTGLDGSLQLFDDRVAAHLGT
jgi:anti-sigma B factor antagonist